MIHYIFSCGKFIPCIICTLWWYANSFSQNQGCRFTRGAAWLPLFPFSILHLSSPSGSDTATLATMRTERSVDKIRHEICSLRTFTLVVVSLLTNVNYLFIPKINAKQTACGPSPFLPVSNAKGSMCGFLLVCKLTLVMSY